MGNRTVITGLSRTPMGGMQGGLSEVSAPDLGAAAIASSLSRSGLSVNDIDEAIMGCVLPAGLGQAPARQAAVKAGLPVNVPATTINKMCGSGMKAIMLAHDSIAAGSNSAVVAGGMESMSNAPHILPKSRVGMRLGHGNVMDHMFLDGLEDAYEKGRLMGSFAEECAKKYGFSRTEQDQFAIESLKRAQKAIDTGAFKREIEPVTVKSRKGNHVMEMDEQPGNAQLDKIPHLRPAFAKDGTVTAANSSSISDGAAAVILMSEHAASEKGIKPLAYLMAHSSHAQEPSWFTTAPVVAIKDVLAKVGWKKEEVGLFEVNEAFAAQALAVCRDLDLPADKVNPNGSGISLGHPIGASGTIIAVKALYELQRVGGRYAVATMCIGGGQGIAVLFEAV